MKIVLMLDDSPTVGVYIESVSEPSQPQCLALRDLAVLAGQLRGSLLYREETAKEDTCPRCGSDDVVEVSDGS